MEIPFRTIVLNEISNVIISLRTNPRFSNRKRFVNEVIRENKLLEGLKDARHKIMNKESLDISLQYKEVLQPFFNIIESEETTSTITAVALTSLKKFISYPVLGVMKDIDLSREIIKVTVTSLKKCQFEVTDQSMDETALILILEVFETIIQTCNGDLLGEKLCNNIFSSCFRIGRLTHQSSENIRRNCEKILESMTNVIFSRVSHNIGKENLCEMESIFQFICNLCNPQKSTFKGANIQSLKLLGLTLSNIVFEIMGTHLSKAHAVLPKLVKTIREEYTRILLKNTNTTNLVIYSNTLRAIENCILLIPDIHEQVEAFLVNGYFRILNKSKSEELKEIVYESLVSLFSYNEGEDFIWRLFNEYDCDEDSSNLLENIIVFLSNYITKKRKEDNLNTFHKLSYNVLYQIVLCLDRRINNYKGDTSSFSEWRNDPQYKEFLLKKTIKNEMLGICSLLNKDLDEGIKKLKLSNTFMSGPENINRDIAKFLFMYSKWINKIVIGDVLKEIKNIEILKEYIKQFCFKGVRIDRALRLLVHKFHLHGESQQVTRQLEFFSKKYYDDNQEESEFSYFENEDTCFSFSTWILMLHTDLHNNNANRGTSLASFITTGVGLFNDNKTKRKITKEELEDIYKEIESNEMTINSADLCDEYQHDSNWRKLLEKSDYFSKNNQELKTKHNGVFFEASLTTLLWKYVLSSSKVIFNNCKENRTVKLNIKVMKLYSKLSYTFFFPEILEDISKFLINFTKLKLNIDLNSVKRDSIINEFSRSERAMESTKCIFSIIGSYSDLIRSSWKEILNLIMRLFELGLINFQDKFWEKQNVFYERTKKEKKKKFSSQRRNFFGFWSSSDDVMIDKENYEKALKCIKQCNIQSLLNEVKYLRETESTVYLIQNLLEISENTKNIHTASFCIKLLVEVYISQHIYGYNINFIEKKTNTIQTHKNLGKNKKNNEEEKRTMNVWDRIYEYFSELIKSLKVSFEKNNGKLSKRGVFLFSNVSESIIRFYSNLLYSKDVQIREIVKKVILLLDVEKEMILKSLHKLISPIIILIRGEKNKLIKSSEWAIILKMMRYSIEIKQIRPTSPSDTTK